MATDVDTPTNPETAVAASTDHERLFRYSSWLHVGAGAENCEDRTTGECGDPHHFHGWCRLPNKLQHREIRDHGLAAKARKTRQLRDPGSNGYEVLEAELDAIARLGDSAREDLIAELLAKDWWKAYLEAVQHVNTTITDDDEDETLVWEHVDQDKARFTELRAAALKHPEISDGDEYRELETRLLAYQEAIDAHCEELRAPRRKELEEKDVNALIDQVRDVRIDAESQEEFLHTYAIWEWATCTRKSVNGPSMWSQPADLTDLADEVLQALQVTYDDLETSQKEDASQGNS